MEVEPICTDQSYIDNESSANNVNLIDAVGSDSDTDDEMVLPVQNDRSEHGTFPFNNYSPVISQHSF